MNLYYNNNIIKVITELPEEPIDKSSGGMSITEAELRQEYAQDLNEYEQGQLYTTWDKGNKPE